MLKLFRGLGSRWLQGLMGLAMVTSLVACGGGGSAGSPVLGGGGTGGTTTPAPKVSLSLSSDTVALASPATVTAVFKDATGGAISGQVVTFTTTGGLGVFSAATALTDASGVASVTLSPKDSTSTGADTVTASVTYNNATYSASAGFKLTATTVTIASVTSDITALGAYAQTSINVTLAGTSSATPVKVTIASQCVTSGRATLVPADVTTTTGSASFTYRDNGCGAYQKEDNLQIAVVGTTQLASLKFSLSSPAVASISFISSSPQSIYLRGSGYVENSDVKFQVKDASGQGVPEQLVVLEPTTLAGGLLIEGGSAPVTKKTDSKGEVTVRINSGTVPTPVRVKATLKDSAIATVSSSLSIAVGLPSQLRFSVAAEAFNIEAYDRDGVPNTYTVIASDRLGNPVPDGTAINFVTEAGQVEALKFTALNGGIAKATAASASNGQRPPDGRVTMVAYALGEESFIDRNGNNIYDKAGENGATQDEDFQDLGDIYLDRLYNGRFDVDKDQFLSLSLGGNKECKEGSDSLLKLIDPITGAQLANSPSRPGSCDQVWGRAYVRMAVQTVWSRSSARPMWGEAFDKYAAASSQSACPIAMSLLTGYDVNGQPKQKTLYTVAKGDDGYKGDDSYGLYGLPGQGTIAFYASDSNSVAYNPVAAGSIVSVSATDGMSVSVSAGSPIGSTTSPTLVAVNYKFDNTNTGTITIKVQSPGGTVSAHPLLVKTVAKPADYVSCTP